jgi:hypothetical protein
MMLRQQSRPYAVVLCLFPWLVASGYTGEVDQLLAAAEQAEHGGQLDVAAELYHRAAAMQPENFNLQYTVGLHCLLIENWPEAEEHLKKTLSLRPDFAPAHLIQRHSISIRRRCWMAPQEPSLLLRSFVISGISN